MSGIKHLSTCKVRICNYRFELNTIGNMHASDNACQISTKYIQVGKIKKGKHQFETTKKEKYIVKLISAQ